jgi:serine/threonine protein phosphatase PrpC
MVKCHARTDVGLKRRHNEDSLLALEEFGLFVVADGVGGRKAGEIASAFAVEAFQSDAPRMHQAVERYASAPSRETRNAVLSLLDEVVNLASKRIYESATATGRQGMTTTVVAALVGGGSAFIVHVGDSRAYLVRDRQLRQLTEDHSLLNYMIQNGTIQPGEQMTSHRNVITRAVGLYPTVKPDLLHIELLEGDRLLLCSDGLSDMATPETILQLMVRPNLRASVDGLIQEALERGGRDNVTVIAIAPDAVLKAEAVGARARAMENLFLFADLPFHARLRVGRIVSERYFTPGDVIMRQGEIGDTLYVVVQGQVGIQVDGKEVAVLQEGEHFGELALVDDQPRSADVIAKDFGHLLCIERDALREYCVVEPSIGNMLLWKLVATLGHRLRMANAQMVGKP